MYRNHPLINYSIVYNTVWENKKRQTQKSEHIKRIESDDSSFNTLFSFFTNWIYSGVHAHQGLHAFVPAH